MGHSIRVGQLSSTLGQVVGLTRVEIQHLEIGGYLHDIGKIGIRDSVLLKPGALSEQEREIIEDHPTIGLRITQAIDLPDAVRAVIGGHHEKLNGTGYPLGLSGDAITIYSRIGAVADIYDALSTDRPYRSGFAMDMVFEILFREAQLGHLDLEIVTAMERLAPEWEQRRGEDPSLQGLVVITDELVEAA
jgi:putative nucleotidyltransferase with HDIG domain